jgi:hypothetical protein
MKTHVSAAKKDNSRLRIQVQLLLFVKSVTRESIHWLKRQDTRHCVQIASQGVEAPAKEDLIVVQRAIVANIHLLQVRLRCVEDVPEAGTKRNQQRQNVISAYLDALKLLRGHQTAQTAFLASTLVLQLQRSANHAPKEVINMKLGDRPAYHVSLDVRAHI